MTQKLSALAKIIDSSSIFIACLAAWLPFVALTSVGIWMTVEPVTSGWFILGMIAATLLLLRQMAGIGTSFPSGLYPLAGLVIWSAAIMPLRSYLAGDFIGTPETGEGVASFCGIFVFSWLIYDLWRNESHRRRLIISFTAAAIAMAVAEINQHSLVTYPDYLAFVAIPAAAAATFWNGKNIMPGVWQMFFWLMIASNNITAMLIAAALLLLWLALKKQGKIPPKFPALIAVSAPVGIAIALFMLNHMPHPPAAKTSLGTRMMAESIAADVLTNEGAEKLITGNGWDSTSDLIAPMAMAGKNASLFANRNHSDEWVGINGDMFHTHNEIVESLLAAGIIGASLLLWWLWRMASGSGNPFLSWGWAAIAALSGMWFWLPHILPSLGLMAGISCRSNAKNAGRIIGMTTAAACAFAMFIAATMQTIDMSRGMEANLMVSKSAPPAEFSLLGWMNGSYKRFFITGQNILIDLANDSYRAENKLPPLFPTDHHGEWLALVLKEIDALQDSGKCPPRLLVLEASSMNALANMLHQKSSQPLKNAFLPEWQERIEKIFFAMPKRNDLLIPFYLAAATHPELHLDANKLADDILAKYPEEPVSLWFSGINKYSAGDKKNGLLNMKRALALGVDRLVPITDDMRLMIEGGEIGSQ